MSTTDASRYAHDVEPVKPWRDAREGEIWLVGWEGRRTPCLVTRSDHYVGKLGFKPIGSDREDPGIGAPIIDEAQLIWRPEATS